MSLITGLEVPSFINLLRTSKFRGQEASTRLPFENLSPSETEILILEMDKQNPETRRRVRKSDILMVRFDRI